MAVTRFKRKKLHNCCVREERRMVFKKNNNSFTQKNEDIEFIRKRLKKENII